LNPNQRLIAYLKNGLKATEVISIAEYVSEFKEIIDLFVLLISIVSLLINSVSEFILIKPSTAMFYCGPNYWTYFALQQYAFYASCYFKMFSVNMLFLFPTLIEQWAMHDCLNFSLFKKKREHLC